MIRYLLISLFFPIRFSLAKRKSTYCKEELVDQPLKNQMIFYTYGNVLDGYYTHILIGSPPQTIPVLIDTGSSTLAVVCVGRGAKKKKKDQIKMKKHIKFHYEKSLTYKEHNIIIKGQYSRGEWTGSVTKDVISITKELHSLAFDFYFICVRRSKHIFRPSTHWSGILGLAYKNIGYIRRKKKCNFLDTVPTMLSRQFTLTLCPATIIPKFNEQLERIGTLVLGEPDKTSYRYNYLYTPIWRKWYYDITILGIYLNDIPLTISCNQINQYKSILDSGTTNLRLPAIVFRAFIQLFRQITRQNNREQLNQIFFIRKKSKFRYPKKGPKMNFKIPHGFFTGQKLLCVDHGEMPWHIFPDVSFALPYVADLGGTRVEHFFKLIWPPQFYLYRFFIDKHVSHGVDQMNCYKFMISETKSSLILGMVFLTAFSINFHRQDNLIGFAQSTCPRHNFEVKREAMVTMLFDINSQAYQSEDIYENDFSMTFFPSGYFLKQFKRLLRSSSQRLFVRHEIDRFKQAIRPYRYKIDLRECHGKKPQWVEPSVESLLINPEENYVQSYFSQRNEFLKVILPQRLKYFAIMTVIILIILAMCGVNNIEKKKIAQRREEEKGEIEIHEETSENKDSGETDVTQGFDENTYVF
ncbi:hypothetical protein SNEBB_002373 [Seison nebaliae]|nr:hypothetical protein SNEBB_002373 [Seison nebaliae]